MTKTSMKCKIFSVLLSAVIAMFYPMTVAAVVDSAYVGTYVCTTNSNLKFETSASHMYARVVKYYDIREGWFYLNAINPTSYAFTDVQMIAIYQKPSSTICRVNADGSYQGPVSDSEFTATVSGTVDIERFIGLIPVGISVNTNTNCASLTYKKN